MRVLVIGGGGREHAIAWACEQHGHTVTMRPDLGDASADDIDLVIPGPDAGSSHLAGRCDRSPGSSVPAPGTSTGYD